MNINSLNLHLVTRHFRARDQSYMVLEVSWVNLWTLSCGLTISGSQLLACVQSGPKVLQFEPMVSQIHLANL